MMLPQSIREAQPAKAVPLAEGQGRLRNMAAYIHSHYGEKRTLAELAARAAVSEREALRCFRKYFQQSPFEYLMGFRLNQAKAMLLETDLPITQISYRCGFFVFAYLGKQFKKAFGMTPLAFRNRHQSKQG